jgi:uncharacterized surface protein with fasciclin (FAS1) repeats
MINASRFAAFAATAVATATFAFSPAASANGPKGPSIVDVAIAANAPGGPFEGVFDTLIAAVRAADPVVVETLSGNGKLTVFAPTDDAFLALGEFLELPAPLDAALIATLPPETLTPILLYHVSRGERLAADVVPAERIRMLGGGFLFKEAGSTTLVDNNGREANIIVTDVEAANGVIHAIDAVVLP